MSDGPTPLLPLIDASLVHLMREVWAARFWIAGGGAVGVVLAVGLLLIATPRYEARMTVSPASPLSSAADASAHPNDTFLLFMNIYPGPRAAAQIMDDAPQAIAQLRADRLFGFMPAPLDEKATPQELAAYLRKYVAANQVDKTALRQLSYVHPDPEFAVRFLGLVHRTADDLIRGDSQRSAVGRIAYLEGALARTPGADHRRALTGLLMEQEHIAMLTRMDEPFSARVVEPPSASVRPVWPRKGPTLLILAVLGALAGFVEHLRRAATAGRAA